MKIKMVLIIGLSFAMLTACRKKENNTTVAGGTMPGTGMTLVHNYTGVVQVLSGCGQTCTQTIPVTADVISDPTDKITVILCKNADCNTNVPALSCVSALPGDPCQTQIPSVNIILGHSTVVLLDAYVGPNGAGYSNYFIHEEVTR